MSPETNGILSPRQAFEDNIRPAELLLRVYLALDELVAERMRDLRREMSESEEA